MTEGKRRRYTAEYKTEIIKRLMPPNNESVVAISREEGVPEGTLYKWRQSSRIGGNATPGNGQTSDKWSSQDKFLRSEEHTSELQSRGHLVCRLLLEKK